MMKTFLQYLSEGSLKLSKKPTGNTDKFLDDLWDTSHPHPFDDRQRIVGSATVHVSPHSDGIHIHDIRSLDQGSGAGTEALKHLTNLADKHGVPLDLHAHGYANTKTTQLKKWYKKHGFESGKGSGDYMTREPKA